MSFKITVHWRLTVAFQVVGLVVTQLDIPVMRDLMTAIIQFARI